MLKLSFILPCYNVGRYIGDCLDSLYAQNLPETEFEVICVNDCSTDNTRDLIADYQKRHGNLRLIDHKANQTVGGARNTGIEAAQGEYIWFVDPDDVIAPDCCKQLLDVAAARPVDILMFNNEVTDEKLSCVERQIVFDNADACSGQEFVERYFPMQISKLCIVWRCLFNRLFLLKNELHYPLMRKSQDVAFLWKAILNASSVASIDSLLYKNRVNPYSVANKTLQAKVAFSERILFGYEIAKLLGESGDRLKPMVRKDMEKTLMWCANDNASLLFRMSDVELGNYYREMKNNPLAVSMVRKQMNRKYKWLYGANLCQWIWKRKVGFLKRINNN